MKHFFLICLTFFSLLSCSSDDDNDDSSSISDQNLSGTVEGNSFTFKGGQAYFRSSSSTEEITINLTNEPFGCETSTFDYGLKISADVPNEVGVYTDVNIVTQDGNNTPFNSIGETVEITAVSATEISGKMKLNKEGSSMFAESIFEGSFTISICE